MPLDPGYDEMLRQLAALGGPSLAEVPVEVSREMFRAMQAEAPEIEVAAVTDITDRWGSRPGLSSARGDGPFPVVMMFHGGGWVIGDLATADSQSREVCRGAGVIVISVDYRLAPEHRFPAAAEDCYSATLWAAEQTRASTMGIRARWRWPATARAATWRPWSHRWRGTAAGRR